MLLDEFRVHQGRVLSDMYIRTSEHEEARKCSLGVRVMYIRTSEHEEVRKCSLGVRVCVCVCVCVCMCVCVCLTVNQISACHTDQD